MSDINPEVTNRLADWLVTKYGIEGAAWKIDYLFRRTDMGDGKYGRPLLPFDGRKTPIDRLEELSDEMQYTMKDIMEREAIADLLERASDILEWFENYYPGEVNTYFANPNMERKPIDSGGLFDMAAKLRADCERSVPVEVGPYAHLACSPDCPANHVDLGEDVTGQFGIREWTAEEIAELQGKWKND